LPAKGNGILMKTVWSKRTLSFLLWSALGLLFVSFSPPAHADSGPLYTSTESVLSMKRSKQDILIVDVRDRDAFDRFRIPGSIHVPVYALKTKTFLRDKSLVLVSEGYPNVGLEQTCKALRDAGFTRASILNGGLRSWSLKKGPVEGDAFASREVARVPPKDFFAQKESPDWLVVIVSGPTASAAQPLIPGAMTLSLQGDPRKFASSLKTLVSGKPGSPQLSILVCDEKGQSYESIERAVQQEGLNRVFYLRGGLKGYRAFLEQQALLAQPGKEEVKRCVNCP
jgi:rhodanese-related sulfurtransferase